MKKYSKETVVGIFMLIGLVCVGYMAVKLGKITIFGDDTYVVYARFNKITGLRTGNPVDMLGLEVGSKPELVKVWVDTTKEFGIYA